MAASARDMLWPQHAEHLVRFSIPTEMLVAAGVRSVTDAEARETLGIKGHRGADLAGILFPYLSPLTGDRVGGRVRLDHSLPDDGGKYISEPGCRHFFFAPNVAGFLKDPRIPVVFVEAEKSGLAITALGDRAGRKFLVISIGGCWGFRRKTGKRKSPNGDNKAETGPSPDFDMIAWLDRLAILALDSNALTNPSVQRARRALTKELSRRGARVRVIDVPAAEGVNGPDDLISLQGDVAMLGLLESPKEADLDVIRLRLGELPDAVDQVEDVLLNHSDRFCIFQRAGELVRAVSLPEPRKGGGLQRCKGTVQLEPLGGVALTEIFSRIARWERVNSKGDIQTVDCPPKIAAFYMSRIGSWRLRVLEGVISAPVLREDGTVLSQPGYDSESGLLFVSNEDWSAIPYQPSRDDAKAALEVLRAPFEQFPFVSEEDCAVHIAALLTAIQRRTLDACPIFGYSAPAQRSGKSLLAESVAIIATGKPAPATAVSGEHEEMRKAIAAALREGHSIINLDNIEVPLSSPDLARAITQSEYQDRLLGESRMLRLPTNVLWTATGNNLVFRGDLACRALMCRIDSGLERPEARTFKIPQLAGFLKANRKQFVAAALTILRAFHLAGRPSQHLSAWGGFDNWSASVREPLVWAGMADPCKTREFVLEDDPEREESLAGIRCLYDVFAGDEFTVKMIIEHCGSDEALRASMLSVAAGRQQKHEVDSRRLGWWLRRVRDRIIGGLRLCRSGKASGVAHWRVEEVRAGGHKGHSAHFPATENTTKSANGSNHGSSDVEQPKNDHHGHHDHRNGEDEIVI